MKYCQVHLFLSFCSFFSWLFRWALCFLGGFLRRRLFGGGFLCCFLCWRFLRCRFLCSLLLSCRLFLCGCFLCSGLFSCGLLLGFCCWLFGGRLLLWFRFRLNLCGFVHLERTRCANSFGLNKFASRNKSFKVELHLDSNIFSHFVVLGYVFCYLLTRGTRSLFQLFNRSDDHFFVLRVLGRLFRCLLLGCLWSRRRCIAHGD